MYVIKYFEQYCITHACNRPVRQSLHVRDPQPLLPQGSDPVTLLGSSRKTAKTRGEPVLTKPVISWYTHQDKAINCSLQDETR